MKTRTDEFQKNFRTKTCQGNRTNNLQKYNKSGQNSLNHIAYKFGKSRYNGDKHQSLRDINNTISPTYSYTTNINETTN